MPEISDGSGENVIILDSDLEELERLKTFIDGFCDREGVPDETRYHLSLALEELVVNAIKHGACEPRQNAIRVAMNVDGGQLHITVCDNGVVFDPLKFPPPDLSRSLSSRPIGGLGIHLVRCLIPDIRYERHGGRNYLYLTKPLKESRDLAGEKEDEETNANRNGNHTR